MYMVIIASFLFFIKCIKVLENFKTILYFISFTEPVVELLWRERHVSENIGEIFVPVRRTSGDLRDELMVICGTVSG